MKFAVLGNGSWGTALAQLLIDNGHDAILWGIDKKVNDEININHTNSQYFGNETKLPETLKSTLDLKEALKDAIGIVIAVPTAAVRSICKQIDPLIISKTYIISVAKGFDPITDERMSQVIRSEIPEEKRHEVVSLIGPSHAEEVILRLLTLVTSTSLSHEDAKFVQEAFSNKYFRVYTNTDEIGAEYSVAIKNIIAIASGCLDGLGYGDNARAALVTRGLTEMVRFGVANGGKFETYMGLTGIGDLMVTCNSHHSRNFMAGYAIGKADSAIEFLKTNTKTVEGIRSAKTIHELNSGKLKVEMPICEAVYEVLFEGKKPSTLVDTLMLRTLKKEL